MSSLRSHELYQIRNAFDGTSAPTLFRSSSEKLLERILAESRANAFKADIVSLP